MSAEPAPGRRPPAQPRPHRGTLRALREGLSEAEWVQFTKEAEEALAEALLQPEPDLQPLLDVIEAWYRTMFAGTPAMRLPRPTPASPPIWRCGATQIVIPRHNEISPRQVLNIFHSLERELGEHWWK